MSGVNYNFKIADLPSGWVKFYDEAYSHATMPNDMKPGYGECVLWGAAEVPVPGDPAEVLKLSAMGDRVKIEEESPLWDHGVYWYISLGLSGGFSLMGDVLADPGDKGLFDCIGRLSWHLNGFGGYRAGCTLDLGTSSTWRKIAYYGPPGVFCDSDVCAPGTILKTDGLPMFCRGSVCTPQECCQPAKQCSVDVCALGSLLKTADRLPPYCATAFCQEGECCVSAPMCKAADCPTGYHLKPYGVLPPVGQPSTGCVSHACTLEECCDESPFCPESVCPGNLTLTTLDPEPYCASFDCLPEDCCSFAGVCTTSLCDIGFQLKTSDLPPWCDRPECTMMECCDVTPPQVNVSDVWFVDLDLRNGFVGGTITWAPPAPSIPNVTHFALYLGDNMKFRAHLQNVSYGTNSFTVPPGFFAGRYLYVWTSNDGGDVNHPVVFDVLDINLTPRYLTFLDLDLDVNEIGGYVSWDDLLPEFHSWEATVCRLTPGLGTSLGVEAGYGNRTWGSSPSFYVDGVPVEMENVTVDYGSVVLVVVSSETREVESKAAFRTASRAGSRDLQDYLETNITDGSIVLLATWGNAARHLNRTAFSFLFAAERSDELEDEDSYALIGVKGHNFTLRETLAVADAYAQASVEVFCPVSHYEAMYADGVNKTVEIDRLLGVGNSLLVPKDTEIWGDANLTVNAVSRQHTSQSQTLFIINSFLAMKEVKFSEDDPTNLQTIGGTVMWVPRGNVEVVDVYRLYIAKSQDGEGRIQVGEDVPAASNELVIATGTPRNETTHLLIYAVTALGEQSYPDATELSELTGLVQVTVVVALVGSVAALQMAKIMEALEKSAKRMDNKAIENAPMLGKFLSDDGELVKVKGGGVKDLVPWRGPASQLCTCIDHHAPKLTIKRYGKAQREGKRCFGLRYTVPPEKFRVKLTSACRNVWDNNDIVLKKVSNNDIVLIGKSGDVTKLHRRPIFWWRIINGSKFCSRAAIRMYAPMICLLGVSFLIAYSGEVVLAAMLIVIAIAAIALLVVASRMACTKEAIVIIHGLPPKRGRQRFWDVVKVVVGCLPAAPAFLAGTQIGYIVGGLAMLGTFLSARKAYGAAALVEGLGGLAIAGYSIFLKATDSGNTAAAAKLTASLMGGAMVAVKAIDTQIENQERLHSKKELVVDELIKSAEDVNSATGMGICNAVALEAFGLGCVESRMQTRLIHAIKVAASGLVLRGKMTMASFQDDIYHGNGTRWPKSPDQLGFAVGRAIDAASRDFCLADLVGAKNKYQREEAERQLNAKIEELEDSLKQMLNGPLASKPVNRYKACVKEIRSSSTELASDLKRLAECLGDSDEAGHRAFVQVLGLYATMMTTTAQYVMDEISSGGLSAVDLRILFVKVQQMQTQSERAVDVLNCLPDDTVELRDAGSAAVHIQEALRAATNVLQGMSSPTPPEQELKAVLHTLREVIDGSSAMMQVYDLVCEEDARYGEVDAESLAAAEEDIRNRTQGKGGSPKFFEESAQALAVARAAVGLVSAVNAEIMAATDRADRVVSAMVESRRQGYRILHLVQQTRELLSGVPPNQIRKLQHQAIEYTLGAPVLALLGLQETSMEVMKLTLTGLIDALQQFSSLLDTRVGPGLSEAQKPGLCARLCGKCKKSRVHPAPESEDEDEDLDDDLPAGSLTNLDTVPELRESAITEIDDLNSLDIDYPCLPAPSELGLKRKGLGGGSTP